MPDRVPEDMPEHFAEDMPGRMPEDMPDRMSEDMPDKMPEDMSDRMPEDLPVTKCIDVMVGITRSKVFFWLLMPHRSALLFQFCSFFLICQVRVVGFYHSCSDSSSFFFSSSSSFSYTTSASTSTSTSALPTRRSSSTSARSGHCWTSTAGFRSEWARLDLNRKVLSAVGTTGPQPGTFRAQWALLNLNLGPSELSEHRWTSAARWNARIYTRKTARIYAR